MPEILLAPLLLAIPLLPVIALILAVQARRAARDALRETERLSARLDRLTEPADRPAAPRPAAPRPSPLEGRVAAVSAPPAPVGPTARPPERTSTPRPAPTSEIRREAPPIATPTPVPEQIGAPTSDLESFLGGRVMLVVGILAVLFGVGYFLRYAITLGLLGPGPRLALASAVGLVAILLGHKMRRRGVDVWGQAVIGLGFSTLFLVCWFASKVYGFLGEPLAIGLALLNTVCAVGLAIRWRAPFLAHLGFLGGYLAPALLGTATGAIGPWLGWLLVLDVGVLAVATRSGVRGLEPMALGATLLYFESWRHAWLGPDTSGVAGLALGALVLAKIVMVVAPAGVRRARPGPWALVALVGAGVYAVVVGLKLGADHRTILGASLLALSSSVWASAAWLRRRVGDIERDLGVFHLVGLFALAFAVPLASPEALAGPALATVALGVAWVGTTRGLATFRWGGVAMLALSLLPSLSVGWIDPGPARAFVNADFLRILYAGLATVTAGVLLRRGAPVLGAAVGMAGTWMMLPILGIETWHAVTSSALAARGLGPCLALTAAVGAVYGVVAIAGWRGAAPAARAASAIPLLAATALALSAALTGPAVTFRLLLHPAFLGGAIVLASTLVGARIAGGTLRGVLAGAGIVFGLVLLTAEIFHHGELRPIFESSRAHARFVAQVGISALWAVYAAALLGLGFARRVPALRWAAMALFAVTVGKAFLVDAQELEAVYRVGSFLALGLTLVGASLFYNRRRQTLPLTS